jgi:glycosyltransferase involved in cell wall biosynthesis
MKKKKVLFVTEASFHPTGYSVYSKEVLSRLHKSDEIEIAELACYATLNDFKDKNIPWKIYPNIPNTTDQEAMNIYNSSMSNKFGDFMFNQALLDFNPDFVMDIRDWWMLEFEERSPFRDFYNWAIMPTVDAEPQNSQWIDTYSSADGVFAYSEFGRDTMIQQSKNIKFVDIASPCASEKFFPIADKAALREEMGVDDNAIIFGTVMRNQRRKLYDDLFRSFRLFLDQNPHLTNCYLYCHTAYPDVGWDIPDLIKSYNLGNRVLMTYKCRQCNKIKPMFFNDAIVFCNECKSFNCTLVSISNKMEDVDLNKIYNLFNVYIQWANSEGWGMPQLEAAYAGLPIVSVYYSAMQSLIDNIDGIGIPPLSFYKELETGCKRAVPDNNKLAEVLGLLANDPEYRNKKAKECYENSKRVYNWDYTADKWLKYFSSTPAQDHSKTWNSPSRHFNPVRQVPEELKNLPVSDQVNWLFVNVLGKPELINTSMWKKMVKDLTYRSCISGSVPGYYFNDSSHPDYERRFDEFSLDKAFNACLQVRDLHNQWENLRLKRMSGQ